MSLFINNKILTQIRSLSTKLTNNNINPIIKNRNPRNLERLAIAYKPDGYHLEKPGRNYWHKLELSMTSRHVTASINHFLNGEVLNASTQEFALKQQLYRYNDAAAYTNLGRVLAQRCLESGLTEVYCNIKPTIPDGKIELFLKAIVEGGVVLSEPHQYKKPRPWDQLRPEKPWDVQE